MSVMEMLRAVRPAAERAPESALDARLRAGLIGLATALVSLLVVLVPSVFAWALDPKSSGGFGNAVGVGASLWLLVHGAHLTVGSVSVAFVPLLLAALAITGAAYGLRRALRDDGSNVVRLHTLCWWGGYAGGLVIAALLTFAGPPRPVWVSLLWAVLLVPGAAIGWTLVCLAQDDPDGLDGLDLFGRRLSVGAVPVSVRRAFGPAVRGAGVLLGLGVAVVALFVAIRFGAVLSVHDAAGAGVVGSVLLVLAQIAALPNLGLWALSWLVGPGFQVLEGAPITWSGAESGLLPLIPVFGALPGPGSFPWVTKLVVLLPLLVGVWIGRRSLAEVARLSTLRTKLTVALTATTIAAILIGLLDVVAGGTLGGYRLASMGAPALWLTLTLALELAIGAAVVVLHDAWRLRR